MSSGKPLVSVIICTYNPHQYTFGWVLDCLAQQTLPATDFEVLVIDNNSRPPLEAEALVAGRRLNLRLVGEARQGQMYARCTGTSEARAPLLVFVDDDNGLAADYLEEALRIAREQPGIGAFGGVSRLLTDQRIPEWKAHLLPYMGVRDYGSQPITSAEAKWGQWEPIGAGMVFRRDVGKAFVEFVARDARAQQLGRRAGSYIGGEDSLLARVACWQGYACSYQPSLRLTHFIKGSRLRVRELTRTIQGCAQSWVINEHLCGRPPANVSLLSALRDLALRLRYRAKQKGWKQGIVEWFWDIGYFKQLRASGRAASAGTTSRPLSRHAGA
jgi:glycosyltransferase involved in cell wall biosynthesis